MRNIAVQLLESNNSIMQQELLPLFPLQVVLFPGTPLALHIFEDRYKEMVGEAIDRKSEFGVVLSQEQGIVNIGCTAIVERVTERYPDGRMDIIAVGRRRFEINALDDELAYLRAEVEFFDDEEDSEPDTARESALSRYEELVSLGAEPPLAGAPGAQPSFQLAQAISDLNLRQLLLNSRSESERMRQIAAYLPRVIEERKAISSARKIAATNGHGKRPAGL